MAVRCSPRDASYGLSSDFDNTDAQSARAKFEYDFLPNATISNQTRWTVHNFSKFRARHGIFVR